MLSRLLAVALGGALGAISRYLLSGWVTRLTYASAFPYGTLAVNVVGSFLLGFLMAMGGEEGRWALPLQFRVFAGTGFLGALTTFSTFSFETLEALRLGDERVALASVAANLAFALGACSLGLQAGRLAG